MGLIAREIERRGIPTLSLSSARAITRRVNPPRAVYTDFPLGHTAGKPHDRDMQRAIMRDALRALVEISRPGEIIDLPYQWDSDDSWKDFVMRPRPATNTTAAGMQDDRVERYDQPQYQTEEDRARAAASPACPGCIWLEERR